MEKEVTFNLYGKHFAAKRWHGDAAYPALALHGWLDNSGSFDFLAPLLPQYNLVAPDLAGHGLTDHRSEDSPYNIWQDVGEMHQLGEQLGWDKFILIGHSRGAAIASLFAATFPEKVAALVLLDGFLPEVVKAAEAPSQLAQSIRDKSRYLHRSAKLYRSLDEAIAPRLEGPIALSRQAAEAIARRGVARSEAGYHWRADHRLRGASEFKLTLDHSEAFARRIACPTLLMLAATEISEYHRHLLSLNDRFSATLMENAGHHLHMEESAAQVAEEINRFLRPLLD